MSDQQRQTPGNRPADVPDTHAAALDAQAFFHRRAMVDDIERRVDVALAEVELKAMKRQAAEPEKPRRLAAYTRPHNDMLAEIRDYILSDVAKFTAEKAYLIAHCGRKIVRQRDIQEWDESRQFDNDPPGPTPLRIIDGRAAFLAVKNLLNDIPPAFQSSVRQRAILLLAIMLWDEDADTLNPVFDALGPWEPDPVNGRWLGDVSLQNQQRFSAWMEAVEKAWTAQPRPTHSVAVQTDAGSAGVVSKGIGGHETMAADKAKDAALTMPRVPDSEKASAARRAPGNQSGLRKFLARVWNDPVWSKMIAASLRALWVWLSHG